MKKSRNRLTRFLLSALSEKVKEYKIRDVQNTDTKAFNRRQFLSQSVKGVAGVSIALTIPPFLSSCNNNDKRSKQGDSNVLDIAILGAGMAGLNCANHLLGSGVNFKVFEASNRLGGRILTHYSDSMQLGIFPEFGGDFIDSDHEDMLQLAKEFNLELVDLIEEQERNHWEKDIYFFDNRKIKEKEIIKEFKKIAGRIARDKDSLGEDYDTADAHRLDNTPLSEYIRLLPCAQWLKDLFVAAFIAEYGLDCEEQSTLNMLDMIDTNTDDGFRVFGDSDERFRIKGGNAQVINKLAQKVGDGKIEKNFQVNEISENDNGTFTIRFENGEQVVSKTVVCTLPFTILRTIRLSLKSISPEKRRCIDELGYGKNTKLVLGYEGQPWRSKQNNAMGYLFTNDMTNGWDGSVNRTENNPFGAYVAYFGGNFSQKLCDESFKNPLAPPSHVWRTELPDERVKGFVEELDKIFIHSKEQFKGKHVFVNWIEYPYVKASYSCYKPGQWTTIAGLEIQPVGNFFFAGEHCSEMFQGFMNGAAETGRRVAAQVLQLF